MQMKTEESNQIGKPTHHQRRLASPVIYGIAILCLGIVILLGMFYYLPRQAERIFGPASHQLSPLQKFTYSVRLLVLRNELTVPLDRSGSPQPFTVHVGEPVSSIATRLEQDGIIQNSEAFRLYLVYTGLDTSVQAGDYQLSAASPAVAIAQRLQNATPEDVTFVVLPGWRLEEIADSLPTSGLIITKEDYLQAARDPTIGYKLGLPAAAISFEGFQLPDSYRLKRGISATQMVQTLFADFWTKLTPDIRQGFQAQGLTIYEGVILASIVQKEAVVEEEQPIIASVFYNRLAAGMTLSSDPTVQYSLGYNITQHTWWKNPLSTDDLTIDSSYNTYRYKGLTPGPISNPSISALRAVAFPATTPYLFFRARCDGSRKHNFAETYQEHLQNACPGK